MKVKLEKIDILLVISHNKDLMVVKFVQALIMVAVEVVALVP